MKKHSHRSPLETYPLKIMFIDFAQCKLTINP